MKLNHINLFSRDIAADRAMFEDCFGLRCLHTQGQDLAVLGDDGDMWLVLNRFGRDGDFDYPKNFLKHHIGFIRPDREDVDSTYALLRSEGFEAREPREFHGAWTFYFKAPGGYFVEVSTRADLTRA